MFSFSVKWNADFSRPLSLRSEALALNGVFKFTSDEPFEIRPGRVNFGYRLFRNNEQTPAVDERFFLRPTLIYPGIWIPIEAVLHRGDLLYNEPYTMLVDFVQESEFWFAERGSDNARFELRFAGLCDGPSYAEAILGVDVEAGLAGPTQKPYDAGRLAGGFQTRSAVAVGERVIQRSEQIACSVRAAKLDQDVIDWLIESDRHKAELRYDSVEYNLWKCLNIYPFHPALNLQYAISLYLQDKLADAEVFLRNSLALGAELESVTPHLKDIARRLHETYVEAPSCGVERDFVEPINTIISSRGPAWLYPDIVFIRHLNRVLTAKNDLSVEHARQMQRSCRTSWDLIVFLMGTEYFRSANLDLLYLIGRKSEINNRSIISCL